MSLYGWKILAVPMLIAICSCTTGERRSSPSPVLNTNAIDADAKKQSDAYVSNLKQAYECVRKNTVALAVGTSLPYEATLATVLSKCNSHINAAALAYSRINTINVRGYRTGVSNDYGMSLKFIIKDLETYFSKVYLGLDIRKSQQKLSRGPNADKRRPPFDKLPQDKKGRPSANEWNL